MRCNKGISMITLIITIIVMIMLAAIAFMAAGDQVGSAQFSKFASEFGEYATNFANAPLAEVTEALGITGKATNKAQKIYAAARDVDLQNFDSVLNGIVVPGGYTSTRFQTDIKDSTGATVELASATTPVYEIKNNIMKEYDGKSFYGNANGKETHWVTAQGTVFTLPGYPRTVDGEERMYITPDLYYVETNGQMITANDLTPIEPQKVGGDVVTGNQTAADAADSVVPGVGGEENQTNTLSVIKVGDYVAYTPDTEAGEVQWRVWEVNGNNVVIMPTNPVGTFRLGDKNDINKCLNDYNLVISQVETVCDNYASSKLGVTASNVRSLTIEDLEDTRVSTLATQKLSYDSGVGYGNMYTYTEGDYFGAKYNEATGKNELSSTFMSATPEIPITLMQTFYTNTYNSASGMAYHSPEWQPLSDNSLETYGTLLGTGGSWLASVCVYCYPVTDAGFYVNSCIGDYIYPAKFFTSDGGAGMQPNMGVRPLVTLSSSSLAIDANNPGDGSASTPWNIVVKP